MIVAGFGMRANVTEASLQDALDQTGYMPDAIATVADKAEYTAFIAFAHNRKLPIQKVSQDALELARTQTQSDASRHYRDTGSVAEAAALVAAGTGAKLVSVRKISTDRLATCAIAITEGS